MIKIFRKVILLVVRDCRKIVDNSVSLWISKERNNVIIKKDVMII